MVDGRTAKKLYHKFKLEYSNKLIFYDKSMKSNVIQSVSLFAVCVPTLLGSKFFKPERLYLHHSGSSTTAASKRTKLLFWLSLE